MMLESDTSSHATDEPKSASATTDGSKTGQSRLGRIGGSKCDPLNSIIANQAMQTLWVPHDTAKEDVDKQLQAVIGALMGIAPQDDLEGMLAGQMVAAHHASMECFRRAMLLDQSAQGRQDNLNQANKLSRTYSTLLEALDRHRGKGGRQKVIVEHVNVHAGGQAVVGSVNAGAGGGGGTKKAKESPCKAPSL